MMSRPYALMNPNEQNWQRKAPATQVQAHRPPSCISAAGAAEVVGGPVRESSRTAGEGHWPFSKDIAKASSIWNDSPWLYDVGNEEEDGEYS
jgi:hypothetical protein